MVIYPLKNMRITMGFGWSTLDFGFQCRQPIPMVFSQRRQVGWPQLAFIDRPFAAMAQTLIRRHGKDISVAWPKITGFE